jgi:type II secretory pathway component PulJ
MIVKKRLMRGFTLLETAVSLCIFSLVMTIIFTVFTQGIVIWNRQEDRIDVEENLRMVMDRMVREIREASAVSSESSVSSSSKDVLKLTVQENSNPVEVIYRYKNSSIYRERYGGVNPLALKISGVNFLCLPEDDPVTVYIKLWGKDRNGKEIYLCSAASRRSGY